MKGRFAIYLAVAALSVACQSKPTAETPKSAPDMPAAAVDTSSRAPVAQVNEPDIKGLKLGASKADMLALFPDAGCKLIEAQTQCEVNHVSYGGSESAAITVSIVDDRVKMIHANGLEQYRFDDMVLGMATKFGPPTSPLSLADLAQEDRVYWSTDTRTLVAIRAPHGSTQPTVALIDSAWLRTTDAGKNDLTFAGPDFGGLRLGATQQEILARFPQADCKDKGDGLMICDAELVRFGETVDAGLLLTLLNGRTQRLDLILLPFQFDDMTSFLTGKFGPPLDDPRLLTDNLKMWSKGEWIMKAQRLHDETSSRVSLTSKVWREQEARHRVAEAAEDI